MSDLLQKKQHQKCKHQNKEHALTITPGISQTSTGGAKRVYTGWNVQSVPLFPVKSLRFWVSVRWSFYRVHHRFPKTKAGSFRISRLVQGQSFISNRFRVCLSVCVFVCLCLMIIIFFLKLGRLSEVHRPVFWKRGQSFGLELYYYEQWPFPSATLRVKLK